VTRTIKNDRTKNPPTTNKYMFYMLTGNRQTFSPPPPPKKKTLAHTHTQNTTALYQSDKPNHDSCYQNMNKICYTQCHCCRPTWGARKENDCCWSGNLLLRCNWKQRRHSALLHGRYDRLQHNLPPPQEVFGLSLTTLLKIKCKFRNET